MSAPPRKVRAAIYCRKSSDEGLDQTFNSLHAQREACLSYIHSLHLEGWIALDDQYDDPGLSGGTLDRPALQRLIRDIEAGNVDAIVCYRIDRLTRSLTDFTKLVDILEAQRVSLVSITEHFNTATSLGRLNLHMILSFAQYERELAGERIRDKFLASRKRGMWVGGWVPTGYRLEDRKLVVNETEAALVRHIFQRFRQVGSATKLVQEFNAAGRRTKRGKPFDKGILYKLLNNQVYIGLAVHRGQAYPGEHEALVDRATWDKVHAILAENRHRRASRTRAATPALLKGLIFGPDDKAMAPSHTRRRGRLYRFCPIRSVPAGEVEAAVINQIRALLRAPEVVVRVWRAVQRDGEDRRARGDRGPAEARSAVGPALPR
jgi:site-specific DNA recombinase